MNRFVWNLRLAGAEKVPGNKTAGEANKGPFVVPGVYQVRLTVNDQSHIEPLEVVPDPRVAVSADDLQRQFDFLKGIIDKISQAHRTVNRLRDLREQVEGWRKRLAGNEAITTQADGVLQKLSAVEDQLIQPGDQKNVYSLTNRPRLNSRLASLLPIAGTADARPTEQAIALAQEYSDQIDEQSSVFEAIISEDISELNRRIREADVPPVAV
jgi:hypothetical protein